MPRPYVVEIPKAKALRPNAQAAARFAAALELVKAPPRVIEAAKLAAEKASEAELPAPTAVVAR